MKNYRSTWLTVLMFGVIFLMAYPPRVSAHTPWQPNADLFGVRDQQSDQTPAPAETPDDRVLPSVGGNAGLVLGAAVLVLIIIGGVVISSRWRSKH